MAPADTATLTPNGVTTAPDTSSTTSTSAPGDERRDRMRAAVTAAQHVHSIGVTLPVVGDVHLPSADELAFLAGIGALAAVGALEWPVALILGTGRLLSHAHRWRSLAAFGDALEHA